MSKSLSRNLKVAVVGATGAVGKELISILQERSFPVGELVPFASPRSLGKPIELNGKEYPCQVLKAGCFEGIDIAFFDASDAISKEWVPQAVEAGAWVVDNSATFRMEEDVLLLVPEVNGDLLEARLQESARGRFPRDRIIAGPNCSTVQLVMALKPIQERWGLKRVVVSTYQSASGAGAAAMDELAEQTMGVFNQKPVEPQAFKHQLAFNCIPQIGGFKGDGYTSEEQKIMEESRKLLRMPQLKVTATAVRVPAFSCHGESVHIECERLPEGSSDWVQEVREALRAHPGIIVQDDPSKFIYPMGNAGEKSIVESATGRDAVYVGRIRKDPSLDNGLNLWVVSDNLRKGAALNAVQIGEIIIKSLG
ncbi:MAG: aspartate-semialdehyde dehydrogenase [Bdellovibrionia bacterium]